MDTFSVTFISPEEMLYKGRAREVIVPASGGAMSILPRHAPLLAALKKGTVKIVEGSSEKTFTIESGFIEVSGKEPIAEGENTGFVNIFARKS